MIPLKDENPTNTFAFVTLGIIIINSLVFFYELSLGSGEIEYFIRRFALFPYYITHLTDIGDLLGLFTSLFLHGSVLHLFGNMIYLWVFGNNIEDRLGHIRFILFYLTCGICASFGHILIAFDSKVPVIGASGAVSGVLGAYIILYPKARVLLLIPFFYIWRIVRVRAVWFLAFWIILQLLSGAASLIGPGKAQGGGIAWFAHIFGFLSGVLFLGFFKKSKKV